MTYFGLSILIIALMMLFGEKLNDLLTLAILYTVGTIHVGASPCVAIVSTKLVDIQNIYNSHTFMR